jgi:hypothetical protein
MTMGAIADAESPLSGEQVETITSMAPVGIYQPPVGRQS